VLNTLTCVVHKCLHNVRLVKTHYSSWPPLESPNRPGSITCFDQYVSLYFRVFLLGVSGAGHLTITLVLFNG